MPGQTIIIVSNYIIVVSLALLTVLGLPGLPETQAEPKQLEKDTIRVVNPRGGGSIHFLSATSDEKHIVTGGAERGEIRWWKLPEFKLEKSIKLDFHFISDAMVSPNGKYVMIWGGKTDLKRVLAVVDAEKGTQIFKIDSDPTAAFSPDSQLIALGRGAASGISVRNVATGAVVYQTTEPDGASSIRFSEDGRWLYVAHYGLSCLEASTGKKVWVAEKIGTQERKQPPFQLIWHAAQVEASRDGRFVATNGAGLFEAASGRLITRYGASQVVFGHDERSLIGVRPPDDDGVFVWNLRSRELILRADRGLFKLDVARVAVFLRQHRKLVLGTDKGNLLVVPIETPVLANRLVTPALGDGDLVEKWSLMGNGNTGDAIEAMDVLIEHPKQAVPFLRKQIRGVPENRLKEIRQLVRELDDNSYRARQRAIGELAKFGDLVRPALRIAYLDANASLSLRLYLEAVYEKIAGAGPDGEWLQAIRGIQVLRSIGTSDAVAALKELASGTADDRIADEARAALRALENNRR